MTISRRDLIKTSAAMAAVASVAAVTGGCGSEKYVGPRPDVGAADQNWTKTVETTRKDPA